MSTPNDRKYSEEHEWAQLDGDTATVGITEFAANSLGDVVFVDLPEVGGEVEQFSKFGEIESVKAVSDLYSPVSGVVVERNEGVIESPELVNEQPYGRGWLLKLELKDEAELETLMDAGAYDQHTAESQ